MPSSGGVSNYAFPVPWPGRRDHCSIQVRERPQKRLNCCGIAGSGVGGLNAGLDG